MFDYEVVPKRRITPTRVLVLQELKRNPQGVTLIRLSEDLGISLITIRKKVWTLELEKKVEVVREPGPNPAVVKLKVASHA